MKNRYSKKLTVADCDEIRQKTRDGAKITDLCEEFDVCRTSIYHHARGDCICQGTVKAIGLRMEFVSEQECANWRIERREKETSYYDLSDKFNREVVAYHVKGDCGHDHGEPAVETVDARAKVTPEMCQEIGRLYHHELMVIPDIRRHINDKHDIDIVNNATIQTHLIGECRHG